MIRQNINQIKKCYWNKLDQLKKFNDLTNHKTYSIDNVGTKEIDDAFSIEYIDHKPYLWIHIACPAYVLDYDDPIRISALQKAATLYLLDKTEYIFPITLVEECFSLRACKDSISLSIRVDFKESGEINEYRVCLSIINLTYNLSYEEADEILDYQPREENELIKIFYLLKKSREYRSDKQEAINLEEDTGYIEFKNKKLISNIRKITNSQVMVSEAMVIYGYLLAQFAKTNSLQIAFRNQLGNTNTLDISKSEFKAYSLHVQNFIIKSQLIKSSIDINPLGHYSLGLECYTQATSPIRRYIDYLTQYQVVTFLQKKNLLSSDNLINDIAEYNIKNKVCQQISRNNKREALLEYLLNLNPQTFSVTFMRWLVKSKCLALVYFKNLHIDVSCNLELFSEPSLGQDLNVQIIYIDKKNDIIKLIQTN